MSFIVCKFFDFIANGWLQNERPAKQPLVFLFLTFYIKNYHLRWCVAGFKKWLCLPQVLIYRLLNHHI